MTALTRRASRRYVSRHRGQIALSLLGVALGVAVVIAVDLANESARHAFLLSRQIITGNATHQIVGGPSGVPEGLYRTLRVNLGIHTSAPAVEGQVETTPDHHVLQLSGIDPFGAGGVHNYLAGTARQLPLGRLVSTPYTGLVSDQTAARLGIAAGDVVTVRAGAQQHTLTIIGLIHPADAPARQALDGVLVTDIATAQEVLHLTGRLSRIDLSVPQDAAGERELKDIRAALPPGTEVIRAASHTQALEDMTRSFQSNLTALSLLALIVGMFLIYNTMTFSVVQRRHFIGLLRALGVTRREVFTLVMGEALVIGGIGTMAGVLMGIALGHGLVHLVTRTINDLYFTVTVATLALSPPSLVKGLAIGIAGTLTAACVPALEATRAPPRAVLSRSALESGTRRALPVLTGAGGAVFAAGLGILTLDRHSLVVSYAGVLLVIVGFAMATPLATVALAGALRPILKRLGGMLGGMAARGVTTSLSRTGVATAALTIAIAATISVGIMIGSFRDTLANWLDTYLRADIFVTTAGGDHTPIDPDLVRRLITTPGIDTYSRGRHFHIDSSSGVTELLALDLPPVSLPAFHFKAGDPDRVWPAFENRDAVIVSESYAYHHRLGVGDEITLRSDVGPRRFSVAGIFYHYGSDQGVVFISRHTYEKYWHDTGITSLGLYAKPGVDLTALSERLRRRAGADHPLSIRTNRTVRELSLRIFDRTFAITSVLRILTIIVAFIGILSALMALQLERAREFAVLRAVGLTPRGLWGMVVTQTALMGLISGLLALPLGLVLATILIFDINRLSFGWTLEWHLHPAVLIQALAFSIIAALCAGLFPAFKMARTPPAAGLREE